MSEDGVAKVEFFRQQGINVTQDQITRAETREHDKFMQQLDSLFDVYKQKFGNIGVVDNLIFTATINARFADMALDLGKQLNANIPELTEINSAVKKQAMLYSKLLQKRNDALAREFILRSTEMLEKASLGDYVN